MICLCHVSGERGGVHRPATTGRVAVLCAMAAGLLLAAAPERAAAADLFDGSALRGTFSGGRTARWDGLNLGVQFGTANGDTDYSKTTGEWVGYSLRETALENEIHPSDWQVLPSQISHGRSYGAFIGYSFQWDQLVLGADLSYNRTSGLDSSVYDGMTRIVTPSTGTDTVTIIGAASANLKEYATLRARAGYAFGQFLPYGFAGGVVGRFDYTRDFYLNVTGADNGTYTLYETKNNAIVAGVTLGLGLDVALTPNVFLRGEWEHNIFAEFDGIRVNTNTARVGLGVRF